MAPHNCSIGSSGKSLPVFSRKFALYSFTNSFQPLAGTSVSCLTPSLSFIARKRCSRSSFGNSITTVERSEEHTSELQSRQYLVCRLLLEKKKSSLLMLE